MLSYATGISVSLCLMVSMIILMVYETIKENKTKNKPIHISPPREFRADFSADMKCLEYTINKMAKEQIDRKILSADEFGYTEIQLIDVPMEKDLDRVNKYIEEGVDIVVAMLSRDMISKLLLYYSDKGLRAFIRMHFRDVFMAELNAIRTAKKQAIEQDQELIKSNEETKIKKDKLESQCEEVRKIAKKWSMDYEQMSNIRNTYINSELHKNKEKFIKNPNKYHYERDIITIIEKLK